MKCEMQQLTERLRLEVEDETDELLVCNCDPAILVSVKLTERRRQRLCQKHHSQLSSTLISYTFTSISKSSPFSALTLLVGSFEP